MRHMIASRALAYAPPPLLGRVHLAIGLAGLLIFLGTGRYMDVSLDHLRGMADAPRALYRSGHIYILLCALLHLLLGAYATPRQSAIGRGAQYLASAAITSALALFVYGFAVETPLAQIERPMTRVAIELAFAGTLLHCIAAVVFASAAAATAHRDAAQNEASRSPNPAHHG